MTVSITNVRYIPVPVPVSVAPAVIGDVVAEPVRGVVDQTACTQRERAAQRRHAGLTQDRHRQLSYLTERSPRRPARRGRRRAHAPLTS